MDNHKLVTISFFFKKKNENDAIFVFYMKNMLGKILGFGRMQQNFFFEKYLGENQYFNTGFIFYSVNIQPDIMQN